MKAVTIDQLRVFREVAETGSFSAAARTLHRAQSAITYAVQKLEEQVGTPLFDRAGYRPILSEAGRAMLPRAHRILGELADFGAQAKAIADGLEPEVSLVVDSMYATPLVVEALRAFQHEFPGVQLRLNVETLGATAEAVVEGRADLAIALEFAAAAADLDTTQLGSIELIPVAAPEHALAKNRGRVKLETLRDHVQLVLTDRSRLTEGRDFTVFAAKTWRLADLGARHAMLLAGLGWGSMPKHMVVDDLAAGRLVALDIQYPDGFRKFPSPVVVLARRKDRRLGPAGTWLAQRLALMGTAAARPAAPRKRKAPRRRAR